MKQLQIVLLNGCLRTRDSQMLRSISKDHAVLFILAAIGGPHKQRFDCCMAHRLPFKVVYIKPDNLGKLCRLAVQYESQLLHQDLQELKPFIEQFTSTCKELQEGSRIELRAFADSISVPIEQFTPVFSLFNNRVKGKVAAPSGVDAHPKYTTLALPATLRVLVIKKCTSSCFPCASEVFAKFQELVEKDYDLSRQRFGALFEYEPPSSSFMSAFISAGCVTVRQLYALSSNATYKQELLWNQYCILYMKQFGDRALQEYGPYERKRKWCAASKQKTLLNQLFRYTTPEPLINAIMRQLVETGYVPNRLRMVFASWLSQQGMPWYISAQIFENWLIDYDFRSNTFNWLFSYNLTSGNQHTFSIQRQIKKFDPQHLYIKRWTNLQ